MQYTVHESRILHELPSNFNMNEMEKVYPCLHIYCIIHILTTDDVQGTEGDVIEAVEWTSPHLFLQLLHQDLCLLVHHLQEVSQDGEMEGGCQHLPPLTPLFSCAAQSQGNKSK